MSRRPTIGKPRFAVQQRSVRFGSAPGAAADLQLTLDDDVSRIGGIAAQQDVGHPFDHILDGLGISSQVEGRPVSLLDAVKARDAQFAADGV
jgi:hypothetical protein